jgi:hypothetical protein
MNGTRGGLDLATTLRAVGAEPVARPPLEALFFHRTLARWLGLPEGTVDGVSDPVQWDYSWWRADLVREADRDFNGRLVFSAHLAAASDAPVETVRWWVLKDGRGRIVDADWLTAPPRLLDDETPPLRHLDDVDLQRLFADDE